MYRLGVNAKPSPYVTLKIEASWSEFPDSEIIKSGLGSYAAQMAVSF
jgi:hypothetical protein